MSDTRTISQPEGEGYPWIGCECCKGTVWVPARISSAAAVTAQGTGGKDDLAAALASEVGQVRMAEDGPRTQHDHGFSGAQKWPGDRGQHFCGRAFDDDIGQRFEFADRHDRDVATQM